MTLFCPLMGCLKDTIGFTTLAWSRKIENWTSSWLFSFCCFPRQHSLTKPQVLFFSTLLLIGIFYCSWASESVRISHKYFQNVKILRKWIITALIILFPWGRTHDWGDTCKLSNNFERTRFSVIFKALWIFRNAGSGIGMVPLCPLGFHQLHSNYGEIRNLSCRNKEVQFNEKNFSPALLEL